MSSIEEYAAKIAEIEAISDEEIKSPNIPIDAYLKEVEITYKWVQRDIDDLMAAGLDRLLVDDLPMRAGALREAESLWINERFTREEAEKECGERSPGAYDMRNILIHDFRFAFRKESDLINKVNVIDEGHTQADMIQDLNDLSVLGKNNIDLLSDIGFDIPLLDTAGTLSDEMADLLSEAYINRKEASPELIIRDKAYTYLKQAMDSVREYGQYVFWRNEKRLPGYVSQYHKHKKNAATEAEPGISD